MTTREALNRSHLVFKDILDQPEGKYYLIIEDSPVHRSVFQVDNIMVNGTDAFIRAEIKGATVVSFSSLFPWKLVNKEYAIQVSTKEVMEVDARENKVVTEFRRGLLKEHKIERPKDDEEDDVISDVMAPPTGVYL